MDMQEPGDLAGRDPREPRHDPQGEALGSGHADRRLHPLRGLLEGVVERPDEAHEVEHGAEVGKRLAGPADLSAHGAAARVSAGRRRSASTASRSSIAAWFRRQYTAREDRFADTRIVSRRPGWSR